MNRISKRATSLTVLALLGGAAAADAGIVVLKNGEVILGDLDAFDVEGRGPKLAIRNPRGEAGQMEVDRHRVRWADAEADELTDDYFAEHQQEKLLGKRWLEQRERWIKANSDTIIRDHWPTEHLLDGLLLDPIRDQGDGFTIRKPNGWTARVDDQILVLEAPAQDGFRPRIHVFSVPTTAAPYKQQVEWIEEELAQVSESVEFRVQELHRPVRRAGGIDQRLLTETELPTLSVRAWRQVSFRGGRTYFFAGYASAKDFAEVRRLIVSSMESLEIREDRR